MKSIEISLGHAAMHSPWLVQAPNPSASICATMSTTRASRSGWPWGRSPRCDTFAATNSMAEALGHAATQAPQPMQAAASIARSAWRFGTSSVFASGALPVRSEEHTSELQSRLHLVCRLLLEKKKISGDKTIYVATQAFT